MQNEPQYEEIKNFEKYVLFVLNHRLVWSIQVFNLYSYTNQPDY